jgi:PadR family transcriptional regulator, regulatory protein PadR
MSPRDQMRKGSTEFVILRLLEARPMYGYEISQQLAQQAGGYFGMKEGLLYPALHRMQEKGLLATEWQKVDGRRRKYYALTRLGRKVLGEQAAEWKTFLEQLHTLLEDGKYGQHDSRPGYSGT